MALTLALSGVLGVGQQVWAGSEDVLKANSVTELFVPYVQAPIELSVDAAKKPASVALKDKGDTFGLEDVEEVDGIAYLPNVNPANACADLDGDYVAGFKVEYSNQFYGPHSWTYTYDGVEYVEYKVTLTIEVSEDGEYGKYFDWTVEVDPSDLTVGAVIIKAGTGANVYTYPDYGWQKELHTPGFIKNNGEFIYRDISNVTFCFVKKSPPQMPL